MYKNVLKYSFIIFYVLFIFSCKKSNNTSESQSTESENTTKVVKNAPAFSADSAFLQKNRLLLGRGYPVLLHHRNVGIGW
jgi:hypothetical protein